MTYRVKKGDSLLSLSFITGISIRNLTDINKIVNNMIAEGMVIKLPRELLKNPEEDVKKTLGLDQVADKRAASVGDQANTNDQIGSDWVFIERDRRSSFRSDTVRSFL